MSYCVNPACPEPENLDNSQKCKTCGSRLLLRNRYQVMQPLGQGGFGATFLAQDISLPGRPTCVVKQLRPTVTSQQVYEMARELFEREANTLGKLGDHPQVPRLLDFFETEKQFYLVQEYIRGSTLKQEVKNGGPFSEEKVKECLRDLMPLLDYIHDQGVIHRDIKPANIIRRAQDNRLVLIDFGAVKDQIGTVLLDGNENGANTRFAVGTFSFAPPEQMMLRPVYASDIYALGMTCLYLLTGKSPKDLDYDPNTGAVLWQNHAQVSVNFSRVLNRMLEPKVARRYQTGADVIKGLDDNWDDSSLAQGLVSTRKRIEVDDTPTIFNPEGTTVFSSVDEPNPPSSSASFSRKSPTSPPPKPSLSPSRMGNSTGITPPRRSKIGEETLLQSGNTGSSRFAKITRWTAELIKNAYAKEHRDFGDMDLSGLNLQKFILKSCNFYNARLTQANLQGADLQEANFSHANLVQANLREANLNQAYLGTANLEGADLRGANLTRAYLTRANLRGTNLCGANLTNATISNEQLALAKTNLLTIRPDGKRGFGF